MSDLIYRLVVDLSTRGSLAPELQKIGSATEKAHASIGSLKDALGGVASGLAGTFEAIGDKIVDIGVGLAKIGAVGAGAALTYGVAGLNAELETTRTSLAAIMNVNGVASSMSTGLEMSADVLKDMRKDAAALPGEFKDLVGIFRFAATPGFQSGAGVKELEKFSANAMAAAAATGLNMEQAGREVGMLLQGRAGAHNVFGNYLGLTGDAAEKFNKESAGARLHELEGLLGKFEPAIEEFGKTFDAQSSTLKDNAKLFLGTATTGLFESVKHAMGEANDWFTSHGDEIEHFATKVGDGLVYAFEAVKSKIHEWEPAFLAFAHNAQAEFEKIWAGAAPILEKIEPVLKRALASPDLFKHLETGAEAYGGLKLGKAMLPGLGSMGSIAQLAGGLGGEEGLAASLGGITAMGPALLVAAVDFVAVGTAVAGALDVLTDSTNIFHDQALSDWSSIISSVGNGLHDLGDALRPLAPVVEAIADVAGVYLLGEIRNISTGFAAFADVLKGVFDVLREKLEPYATMLGIDFGALHSAGGGAPGAPHEHELPYAPERGRGGDDQSRKTPPVTGGGGMHIQKVEIVVSSNQDPSRIARLTVEKLQELARNPTRPPGAFTPLRR